MRGTVHPVRPASLRPAARDQLLADSTIPVVSLEDLYGKLVAALDRQHPRDLFDVMQLFAHEGIAPGIRRAFAQNFQGMTVDPIALEELLAARERLMRELPEQLDADERGFLLSVVANRPEWSALGVRHLEHLPGLRWKLQNLERLEQTNGRKFDEQADALARRLSA